MGGLPFFDRGEVQLDARGPAEDRHFDLQLLLVHLHVVDGASEVGEGAVQDADLLAHLERQPRLRLHRPLDDAAPQVLDLRDGHLLRSLVADEASDLRRVLHEVPHRLAHLHLDEDIAREAELLPDARLAARLKEIRRCSV